MENSQEIRRNLYESYSVYQIGSPDVLNLTEVETPIPEDNQVLEKNHAASLKRTGILEIFRNVSFSTC